MKLIAVVLLSLAALTFGHQRDSAAVWDIVRDDVARGWEDVSEVLDISNAEHPPFTVISRTDNYEQREYDEGDYVITDSTGPFTIAFTKGIAKLYSYFLGRNEDEARIDRTTPAFVRFLPNEDFSGVRKNEFAIGMWLPKQYQGKAPKPTADDIKIVHVPESRTYVREFGGYATEGRTLEEALRLKAALLEDKVKDFDDDCFNLAVYDPPTTLTGRHNEVIFKAGSKHRAAVPLVHNIPGSVFTQLRAVYADLFN